MYSIAGAVLGLAAIGVYFSAVRQGKNWGTPVLSALALMAMGLVLWPLTPMHQSLQQARGGAGNAHYLTLLAEALGPELSPGARVLFVADAPPMALDDADDMGDAPPTAPLESAPDDAQFLERIAEFEQRVGVEIQVAGPVYIEAAPLTAGAINAALRPYRNRGIDLIVADRLPTDGAARQRYPLQELSFYDWPSEPMFAAHAGSSYNPEALREHLEAGRLRAVTLQTPRHAMIVVGSDEIDRIPSRAPFGPFSQ